MGEIDRRLAPRNGDLLENHLGLDAVLRPPIAKAALERPGLPRVKLLGVARPQHLQHPLRFEHALGVAPQQGLHVRGPHCRKGIRPRPPIAGLFRRRRDGTRILLPGRPETHATGGCHRRLGLTIHTCLPHEPHSASVTIDHRLTQPAG